MGRRSERVAYAVAAEVTRTVCRTSHPHEARGPVIELLRYLRVLRQRWLLVVVVIAAAILAAFLITPRTPQYVSNTTLLIGPVSTDVSSGSVELDPSRQTGLTFLALTYIQMLQSLPVAEETVRQTGVDISPQTLADSVQALNAPGTQLLRVSVRSDDPGEAQVLTDATAQSFIELLREQQELQAAANGDAEGTFLSPVTVYAAATLPDTPLDNGLTQNVLLALLFGVLLAVGLVLVLEYVDLTLRTPEDIERRTGLPVLGVIPMARDLTGRAVVAGAVTATALGGGGRPTGVGS